MSVVVDVTKTQFSTTYQVDKIPMYSTFTDSSGSGIGIGGAMSVPAPADPTSPSTYTISIPNPYGKKCLMTLSWSVDGVNYLPMNTPLYYFNVAHQSYYWQALAFGGCSDSTIYFAVDTQYTSAQTIYFQFGLDSPT